LGVICSFDGVVLGKFIEMYRLNGGHDETVRTTLFFCSGSFTGWESIPIDQCRPVCIATYQDAFSDAVPSIGGLWFG